MSDLLKSASRKFGKDIAVETLDESITYERLYLDALEKSRQFSFTNQPIAILGYRNIKTITQIYSVILSENYYIPIDPVLPKERVQYILKKTEARLLLDDNREIELSKTNVDIPYKNRMLDKDRISYIIFTSGSTGDPKGVVETNDQVINTLVDLENRLNLNSNDIFLGLSSFAFDLSVFDIFAPCLVGGKLFLVKDQRNFDEIIKIVSKNSVTIWNSVPAVLDLFLADKKLNNSMLIKFKACLLSGDYISKSLASSAILNFKNAQIYSLGGATECSIWSILYQVTKDTLKKFDYIPYGYPMKNQKIYVLDNQDKILSKNKIGQIAIAGAGVALGYVGDLRKTKEAFIEHEVLGRIYLTGDLGEYKSSHIKFIGRKDTQVKINGYRIGLNSISTVFQKNFKRENVVILLKDEEKIDKLVLLYTGKSEIEETLIRSELKLHLNKYEIPHFILYLKNFKLTNNGKVDKKFIQKKRKKK